MNRFFTARSFVRRVGSRSVELFQDFSTFGVMVTVERHYIVLRVAFWAVIIYDDDWLTPANPV